MSADDRNFEVKLKGITDAHEVVAEQVVPGEHFISFYSVRPGYSSALVAAYRTDQVTWVREQSSAS